MTALQDMATWASGIEMAAIPADALTTAKRGFLDTFGVTLLGSRSVAAKAVAKVSRETGSDDGPCTLIGFGRRTNVLAAALVNGTSAHADLFDDNNAPMVAHPSSPLVSALLPLAQARKASGADVLTAYCAGFEVGVTLGRMLNPSLYEAGWHATRVLGVVGTAAAAARLLKLDARRTEQAMAVTASMASGIRQAFGTMTMALHVGLTARDGIHAALLAEAGFGADSGALEGKFGFIKLFSGLKEIKAPTMGQPFELVRSGIIFKPYPSGAPSHAAIDCVLALLERVNADDIASIECLVHPWNAITLREEIPRNPLQAKVNLKFCIAAAFARCKVSSAEFTDSSLADPAINRLMDIITIRVSEDLPDNGEFPAAVHVTLSNGSVERERRDVPRGGSSMPLSQAELEIKFRDCANSVLDTAQLKSIPALVDRLEFLPDVEELARAMEGQKR